MAEFARPARIRVEIRRIRAEGSKSELEYRSWQTAPAPIQPSIQPW